MNNLDLSDVDVQFADERLTPGRSANDLPDYWKPWTIPRPTLKVDQFIQTLIERQNLPRIRSHDDLFKSHRLGRCPFAVARSEVSRAVLQALIALDNHEYRARGTAAMSRAVKAIPKLRADIAELIEDLMLVAETQRYQSDGELEELGIVGTANDLGGVWAALDGLQAPLDRLRLIRSQDNANLWRVSFAGSLFDAWHCLTGREASSSGEFVSFLDAAWESLSDRDPPNWESAVRTAKKWATQEHGPPPWRRAQRIIGHSPTGFG